MSKFKYNGLSQRFGGTPGLKCDQFLCITCPVYIGAFHQLEYPSSAAWQHPRDVIEYTSVASGVFRNLKRGCPGLHFRCTFSKVFLTKYLCKKLYFNSRGQPQFTSSNLLLGDNLLQKPPSPPPLYTRIRPCMLPLFFTVSTPWHTGGSDVDVCDTELLGVCAWWQLIPPDRNYIQAFRIRSSAPLSWIFHSPTNTFPYWQ